MSSAVPSSSIQEQALTRARGRSELGLNTLIPVLLLFVSGAAALVYQVLWIKQLSLVVGVEVYAVTTGISAFFAGLALGGWLFGRLADRITQPVRLYAGLELAVAMLGVSATWALGNTAMLFARLESHAGLLAWLLPFAIVGMPAFLMGGTLPVLVRALARGPGQAGRVGGLLYAANTAGAIAGTLLTAFLLVEQFGVQGSALAAAAMNLLAAAGACWACGNARPLDASASVQQGPVCSSSPARLAATLYCVAGGVALGYEVVWTQSLVQFMSTRTYAFAVVLATYLLGLMLGSALYARRADRIRDPWGVFGLLIALAGLLALLQMVGLGRWLVLAQTQLEAFVLSITHNELAGMCARFAVASLSLVLLPTTLLGAAFPLALRLGTTGDKVGRDVGTIVALNTLGGIMGVLLTGFVLIPALGLVRTLVALAVVAACVGGLAVWRGERVHRRNRFFTGAVMFITAVSAVLASPERLAELLPGVRAGSISFYKEGAGGTVAVVSQGTGERTFSRLYIQGVSNTGDAMPSLRYMRLQALLPLLIHGQEPRSALVIGFGTGITAGALLQYPNLQRPTVAELLPQVLEAAPLFKGNYGALTNPRLDIRLRDGRRELLRSDERYDMITLEPPPPSATGVVNLYSRDFYELAATRLEQGGVVAQWLPLPTQNEEDSRSLVRSFIDVFPHATLWTTEFHEMLLIGSLEPLGLDAARIAERFAQPSVKHALQEVGVNSVAALLATWITDREGLQAFAAHAEPVTDDRPRIEYASWVRSGEIGRVLPTLLSLRKAPPLRNADAALAADVEQHWQTLTDFYTLALFAYQGEREAWAKAIRQMPAEDRQNPYFRWFLPGAR